MSRLKTNAGVPRYALHHNKKHFSDASAYELEPWFFTESTASEGFIRGPHNDTTTADVCCRNPHMRSPQLLSVLFSMDRASYIGKDLACRQISLVVAQTLWLYDMRLERGSTLEEKSKIWSRVAQKE